ncbi:MAG: DEAD/DEAH box helicase, partial [Planctomycetota bacterium]
PSGGLRGAWRPWLSDDRTMEMIRALVHAMPPAARAARDKLEHQPWPIVEDLLSGIIDGWTRQAMLIESMGETIEGRDPGADPHVAWLGGLITEGDSVDAPGPIRAEVVKRVRNWIGGLEERGANAEWRLLLRVNEPVDEGEIKDMEAPPASLMWSVSFHLQAVDSDEAIVDAADLWLLPTDTVTIHGRRLDEPQELLLAELARSARLFKPLERALDQSEPIELLLQTDDAYEFLREIRPLLKEQGFGVEAPAWWDSPTGRLGARLRLDPPDEELGPDSGPGVTSAAGPQLGLTTLVNYHWEIAIGDTTLSLHEFEQLASKKAPLMKVGGRWVEIRPEDVEAAIAFIKENPGGEMEVGEALRLAYTADVGQTGVPVLGMETSGWVTALLGGEDGELPELAAPEAFQGSLRPYQARGLSWMSFLQRFGFGVCLADDMGLGKTIQLLALLQAEREEARRNATSQKTGMRGPTLIVAPMSVLGNWQHETRRFCPELNVKIHHGAERLQGDPFVADAILHDVVVTTYALVHRDREFIERVPWSRLVLDEAQNIKNPQAKQSQAVRQIPAARRIALTGTPVENRLAELWSIMDFLNPGYLGQAATFRKKFSVPIERYHDASRAGQLRGLVRPFVLRRLKTDPDVVSDLPEKIEAKEYCHLTPEQAQLYENCVKRMLTEVEQSEGMHRRGLVLSALVKLKQICNHPSQMLKDWDAGEGKPPDVSRSGKCVRLMEMLEEIIAEGDQALVFTQFRQMGHLLAVMIRHELDRDVFFLHGGSSQTARVDMVDKFQKGDKKRPIMIASLKAGGVGLNLTAANHVFHFDRWWNPAVENQATDRAFRIGQTRTVFVHKYVVSGTLEERIDEMIEQKTELAEQIVGAGERWLTELDTDQLRDILTLRADAVGDEEEA